MPHFLTVKDISQRSGVKIETIRYYEKIGALPTPVRASNGYRMYDEHILIHIEFIKNCRSLGFSMEEIKQLDNLRKSPKASCSKANNILIENLHKIQQKIQQLQQIEKTLTDCCDCNESTIAECKIMALIDTHRGGHEHSYYHKDINGD